ncbi:MAG TPA: response regulator, partial [Noviherbaspirillum sp.]|nr:response regulator [Noviherbaspirillum sp.]
GTEGQISLEASAARQDGDCCRLCVTISVPDSGSGGQTRTVPDLLDLLDLPELADLAAIRLHGRIGLELALCKRLARLMNGKIEVHGQAGAQVLRFAVDLPCVADATVGVRILLMAQHATDGDRLAEQMRASGMRVDAFDGVSAALAALAQAASGQDPYRIAILGGKIQGMDCEVLGAAIKADAACRDVLLVALGAWPRGHDEPDLAQAGFCAVIASPPQPEQVLDTARTLCEAIAGGRDPGFITPDFVSPGTAAVPQAGTPAFAGRRVLVADDNPVNRQVAQRMVQNLGCAVDMAADGEQALAMHAAQPYDLILMDCQMPQLDGYQATGRIRALEGAASRVPVIAVTACATPGEREKCLACGMDDFIAKPVRPHLLAAAIGRWLGAAPEKAPQPGAHAACADELDVVRDMFGADFAELARLYQKDSPPRIAALQQAGAAQDYPHMAKVAHALSGSSVSIGATGLSTLCKELELCAKAGAVDDFTDRLAAIEAEYDRIGARLRSMVRPKAEPA